MNVLVTGANGQLGNCIRLASKESADRYIFTTSWRRWLTEHLFPVST